MISNIRFSALSLSFPRGKTQIATDKNSGKDIWFTDWALERTNGQEKALLLDSFGKEVASYPIRREQRNGFTEYIIDELDSLAVQG